MDEIVVLDYNPRWPDLFAEEAAHIREAIDDDNLIAVEHFGSTAVPGLSAKPIIDLLVGVRSVVEARAVAVPKMEALGYAFWYDNPEPKHLFFVKGLPPNGPRTHHVHMVEPETFRDPKNEGFLFWDRLLFRDYLRTHPGEVLRYETVKRDLATRFPDDREKYTDGKAGYVASVMEKARRIKKKEEIC